MPGNTAPKRTSIQREHDRVEIARRYLHGESQSSIARDIGVSQQQISYDLAVVRDRWLKASLMDFNERKARELAAIDELERTYWEAWQASRQEKSITETRKRSTSRGDITEAMLRREPRDGNPAFLAGAERCILMRAQLLNLTEQRGSGGMTSSLAKLVEILEASEGANASGGATVSVGAAQPEGDGEPQE